MKRPTTKLKLLIDQPVRQRCIDRVADNLSDILIARERKITWQKIADSLEIERCTLINAVRFLREQKSSTATQNKMSAVNLTRSEPPMPHKNMEIPDQSEKPAQSQVTNKIKDQPINNNSPNVGIRALGRTRIDKFNL